MIDPSGAAGAAEAREARRVALVQAAIERTQEDHKLMNARKIMIEKRKEEQELALMEQEKEEERRRAQVAREAEVAEERRRREDATRREIEVSMVGEGEREEGRLGLLRTHGLRTCLHGSNGAIVYYFCNLQQLHFPITYF